MPLAWRDLFFEQQAEAVLELFELSPSEKERIQAEWSEELFEIDKTVFHGMVEGRPDAKHIIDGRNSALLTLQTLCEQHVTARGGIRDKRAEMRKRMNDGDSNGFS